MKTSTFPFVLLSLLLFSDCKKKEELPDTSSVGITLIGDESLTLNKGVMMNDPGAKASNKDGVDFTPYITSDWSTKFSPNKLGTVEVLYQIIHEGKVLDEKKRKITVIFPIKFPLGNYAGTYTYSEDQGGMPSYTHSDPVTCSLSPGPAPDQYIFNCDNKLFFNSTMTVTAYDCELKEFSGGPGTGSPYRYKAKYVVENRVDGHYQTRTYSYDLVMQ